MLSPGQAITTLCRTRTEGVTGQKRLLPQSSDYSNASVRCISFTWIGVTIPIEGTKDNDVNGTVRKGETRWPPLSYQLFHFDTMRLTTYLCQLSSCLFDNRSVCSIGLELLSLDYRNVGIT